MKTLLLCLFAFVICTNLVAQTSEGKGEPETFVYEWEGEKFTMQKYFIIFLKNGPNRNQSEEKAATLQQEHLAYLGGLYQQGIINLNGPSGGEGEIRGFSVYNVATIEQAIEYASADPMVKAGRLVVEAHPWWLAKGSGVK
ncbi:MAG: YciI family protein [Balneolales bacterium]|nr:YciI family protein [Balneolales bacterium]